jgi:hypothetical protein
MNKAGRRWHEALQPKLVRKEMIMNLTLILMSFEETDNGLVEGSNEKGVSVDNAIS